FSDVALAAIPGWERFAAFAPVPIASWWVPAWGALALLAINLLWVVLYLAAILVGIVVAFFAFIATLDEKMFTRWWHTVKGMENAWSVEGDAFAWVRDHDAAYFTAWTVLALVSLGPTVCAAYVHAARASLRRFASIHAD